jgi:hypothetical protein
VPHEKPPCPNSPLVTSDVSLSAFVVCCLDRLLRLTRRPLLSDGHTMHDVKFLSPQHVCLRPVDSICLWVLGTAFAVCDATL